MQRSKILYIGKKNVEISASQNYYKIGWSNGTHRSPHASLPQEILYPKNRSRSYPRKKEAIFSHPILVAVCI
jgi:hypothetical protein